MLISILIDCSFHSYCPCLHCFSHHYSVACFASIVVVVPVLDTRHWTQSDLFEFCYRPSRDFRLAPPFPLIVRKGTERGSAVRSVRTSRGFAVLDLLLPLFRFGSHDFVSSSLLCCSRLTTWVTQYIVTCLSRPDHTARHHSVWSRFHWAPLSPDAVLESIFRHLLVDFPFCCYFAITLLFFLFISPSILQFRLELLALSVSALNSSDSSLHVPCDSVQFLTAIVLLNTGSFFRCHAFYFSVSLAIIVSTLIVRVFCLLYSFFSFSIWSFLSFFLFASASSIFSNALARDCLLSVSPDIVHRSIDCWSDLFVSVSISLSSPSLRSFLYSSFERVFSGGIILRFLFTISSTCSCSSEMVNSCVSVFLSFLCFQMADVSCRLLLYHSVQNFIAVFSSVPIISSCLSTSVFIGCPFWNQWIAAPLCFIICCTTFSVWCLKVYLNFPALVLLQSG